jgi:hypothetical protein
LSYVDPQGLFGTSVDAACMRDPRFCAEIMGDIVQNAGAMSGDTCLEELTTELRSNILSTGDILSDLNLLQVVKKVPNPWGKRGSPAHVNRVAEAEKRLKENGWELVAGGSRREQRFGNRFPDLVFEKNGKTIAIQVGRRTFGGRPVAREARAIRDLRNTGEFNHVFFIRY